MWPCKQDTEAWLLLSKKEYSQKEKVSKSEPVYKTVTTAYKQYTCKQGNYVIDILFIKAYQFFLSNKLE